MKTLSVLLCSLLPVVAVAQNFGSSVAFRAASSRQPAVFWVSDLNVTGNPVSAWGLVSLSHGTSGNRPAVTASAFGSTQGLTFDGSDDLLTNISKVVFRTGAASLSVIFKTASTVTNGVIVSQSDSSAANDWWEFGIATDGKLYVESNAAGTKHTVKGSTVLNPSTIYNAILTYDGTDFYLILNNVEENPLVIENAGAFAWMGRVNGTPVFAVGATVPSGGAARFFNGVIGAIYFWNFDLTQ